MLKKYLPIFIGGTLLLGLLAGCGEKPAQPATVTEVTEVTETMQAITEETAETVEEIPETAVAIDALPDGLYSAKFDTDSGMFHVSEAKNGRGILTVKNGEMTIHVSLTSKKIVNLYPGTAEAAKVEGAGILEPTVDTVTYSDGISDEVFGFDIPVPALDTEFDCALVGTKGTWYDHKVSVSNPVPLVQEVEVTLTGGSGKAKVASPAKLTMGEDGIYRATIVWSSSNYEYMLVGETQYDPIQTEGNSTFEIPVELDKDIEIQALTVAMSSPHLVSYTLHFFSQSQA